MAERHTVQKDIIYAVLCELANHPTADMVYEQVQLTHPSVSKATVYRVLGRMAEQGSILRLPMSDGADHFDHQTHPHYHVYCEECGRVADVIMPELGNLCAAVTDSCGYELTGYRVLFKGRCPDCRK
ncbi:MAG: transcriptional repressor [Clostridiales bacterium]|nr:transcriptional repressor [Candidatus Cacconaster stercorequi]